MVVKKKKKRPVVNFSTERDPFAAGLPISLIADAEAEQALTAPRDTFGHAKHHSEMMHRSKPCCSCRW